MSKIYDTGKYKWKHGQVVEWCGNGNALRWLLGPCPRCGSVTSNYGGGMNCHKDYCPNSATIFVCHADPIPDWWNTDIDIKLDGNAWCATGPGFINLQESDAGFGDTPQKAVEDYRLASSN